MNFLLDHDRDRLEVTCADCGHVRKAEEEREDKHRCAACKTSPARWSCAPVEGPALTVGRRLAS